MSNFARKTKASGPGASGGTTDSYSPDSAPKVLTVEKLVTKGKALGRVDGRVVLVEGGLPGETLLVRVGSKHKGVPRGRIVDVLEPSVDRVLPPCSNL